MSLRHVWKGSHPHILERISCSLSCAWRNRATKQPQKLDSGGFRASMLSPSLATQCRLHSELAKTHKNTMTHYDSLCQLCVQRQEAASVWNPKSSRTLTKALRNSFAETSFHFRANWFVSDIFWLRLDWKNIKLKSDKWRFQCMKAIPSQFTVEASPTSPTKHVQNWREADWVMSSHLAFLRTHQVQKLETAIEAFDLLQFDLDGTGTRHKSFKVISHTSFGISSNLFQSCKSLHTVSALVEYSPRAHYANQCQGASGKDGSKGKAVSGGTCNVNFSVDDTIRYKGSK